MPRQRRSWHHFLQMLLAAAALWQGAQPAAALERVELELVLAVDCSSSVSSEEYTLQMHGIAAAFEDPRVLTALELSGSIAVALLQWSSAGQQAEVIAWTRIDGARDALAFAERVRAAERRIVGGATALNPAINASVAWTQTNAFQGERVVIDVSGDGRANEGGSPAFARAAANRAGVTINGLAILNEDPYMDGYYLYHVIGGTGSFVMSANNYEDYAAAMLEKLLKEISGAPLVMAPGEAPGGRGQLAERPPPTRAPR